MLKISNRDLWYNFVSPDINIYDNDQKNLIMNLSKERANFSLELKTTINIFFSHEKTMDVSEETKDKVKFFLKNYSLEYEVINYWVKFSQINKKELREVVCSGESGPELARVISIIGIDEFKKRFEKYTC